MFRQVSLLLILFFLNHPSEKAQAGFIDFCGDSFSRILKLGTERLNAVRGKITSDPSLEWDFGNSKIPAKLNSVRETIERLTIDDKKRLLSALATDAAFRGTKESYQQFVRMLLNDPISWKDWIRGVRRYGLKELAPITLFNRTLDEMPENVRKGLLSEISLVYPGSKKASDLHPYLVDQANPGLTQDQILKRRARWFQPKRVFDVMIHHLSGATERLADQLRSQTSPQAAYREYLRSMSQIHSFSYDEAALDVYRAMQAKLEEVVKNAGVPPGRAKIIVYGSFPNGLADVRGSFDLDLAVSTREIASGKKDDFGSYLGTQSIELAGMNVLKNRYGVYPEDPISSGHRSISIDKLSAERLDILSPVLVEITANRINLIVRRPRYSDNRYFVFSNDTIKGYSFSKRPIEVRLDSSGE